MFLNTHFQGFLEFAIYFSIAVSTYDLLSCDSDFFSACWWNLMFFTILALKSSKPLRGKGQLVPSTVYSQEPGRFMFVNKSVCV